MGRISFVALVLIGVGLIAGTGVVRLSADDDPVDDAAAEGAGAVPPSMIAVPALDKPLHWSATPQLPQGNEVALTRFMRFHTREGRTYNAKMFLIEFRPERLQVKEADRARMKGATARVVCWAYEIEAGEGYQPDYDVPARYVQQTSAWSYRISLGLLTCDVRLVRRDKQ